MENLTDVRPEPVGDRGAACLDAGDLTRAAALLETAMTSEPGVREQFMSDVHGESAAFDHLLRSASGETRALVERSCASVLGAAGVDALCALLYYPEADGAVALAARAGVDLTRLAADVRAHGTGRFHLVGDLWDRGARGDDCADALMACADADVQWGNHDVCWMGAAAGDPACIATCLRNNLKYGNVAQFEEGYGIDLEPLVAYAQATYADDGTLTPVMKAASALLFKSEGQAVRRHPEWRMGERLLWGAMDPATATVPVYGEVQPLTTDDFPTWDAADPFAFNADEARLMAGFVEQFTCSARLQRQVRWLYDHGSVWRASGDALMFHGCVPLEQDGSFALVDCGDGRRAGRALLDWVDALCRRAFEERDQASLDWMGYLWAGWQSTFAGRVVKTFERTYIADKETWKEPEDPYYALTRADDAPCRRILEEFGIDPERGVIVNGHTPVKLPKGESPVRAGGKRLVIDGGLCKAYRKTTGIAGYTLLRRADGTLQLVEHGEFCGLEQAVSGKGDTEHRAVALGLSD